MKLVIELRTRNVSLEQWRESYHSEGFGRIVQERARLRERVVVEASTLADGRQRRKVRVVPDVALPRPVQKLVGANEIAYWEITTFDPATLRGTLEIESEAGDAVRVAGDLRYEVDDGGVRLRFEGDVRVSVFAIGGLIERLIAREVTKRYSLMESLLQEYVDGHHGRAHARAAEG